MSLFKHHSFEHVDHDHVVAYKCTACGIMTTEPEELYGDPCDRDERWALDPDAYELVANDVDYAVYNESCMPCDEREDSLRDLDAWYAEYIENEARAEHVCTCGALPHGERFIGYCHSVCDGTEPVPYTICTDCGGKIIDWGDYYAIQKGFEQYC